MIGSYPWPGAKTSPGEISKTQICHISNHLFSHTYPLLTAIKLPAWPSFKHSSLYLQFTPQLLTSLGTWAADKSFLYDVVKSTEANIVSSLWSLLRLIGNQSLSCAVTFSVCACFSEWPAIRGARACAPRTNLPDTWQDFRLLEGSDATNYLHRASQPSR